MVYTNLIKSTYLYLHLHLGPAHHFGSYHLNGLENVTPHKDLGVLFDEHLKFHNHTTEVSAKVNRVLGMIKRSFEHLDTFYDIKTICHLNTTNF